MVWPRAQSAACSLCPCPVILFRKLPSRIPLPTPGPPGTAPLTIPGKPQVKFRSPSLAPASQTAPTASPPPHGPEGNLVAPGDSPLTIHPPFPLPPPLHSQATTASEPPSHQPVNPCSPQAPAGQEQGRGLWDGAATRGSPALALLGDGAPLTRSASPIKTEEYSVASGHAQRSRKLPGG